VKLVSEKEKKIILSSKWLYDDRYNGVGDFLTKRVYRLLRGNDAIYGDA